MLIDLLHGLLAGAGHHVTRHPKASNKLLVRHDQGHHAITVDPMQDQAHQAAEDKANRNLSINQRSGNTQPRGVGRVLKATAKNGI
jgi:hypothetical protein